MPNYAAPVRDMAFVLNRLAGLEAIAALPGCEEASPDLVAAVVEEAGRFAADVLAPLNPVGDREGCERLGDGSVKTPAGFRDAYARFVEGGWNALPFEAEYGGQGLPWLVSTAVTEIWHAANMSFALCPMLNQGAVELLQAHAAPGLRRRYLPKMVSGEWTGTMCLTEPQAGSDLTMLRSKARPAGDGTYRISGQKIFITYGEHDFADNIVHLVLARLPDAPAGTKGISLFLVPKVLPDGSRNDVQCVSLEHKLGIHASPTCVMAFGEGGGAMGWLIGEENQGLACMFTMMNNARLTVGLEGVSIAERAYQRARAYARERVQGRAAGGREPATIIHHPDVRRMLMMMKALTEAARAIAYYTSAQLDIGKHHPDAATRRAAHGRVDLLTPVVKGWCTEVGIEVANLGIQVHGGMGFIEETGAAQHLRDARIAAIYEGTNGIQALDLVGRKLLRDGGAQARAMMDELRAVERQLATIGSTDGTVLRRALADGLAHLDSATTWLLHNRGNETEVAAAATPYLRLWGLVCGGWMMARAALAAQDDLSAGRGDPEFLSAKIATARFYAEAIMPQAGGVAAAAMAGAEAVMALREEQF